MNGKEIFESSVRSSGDYGGVFEADDECGYFYLYGLNGKDGERVLGGIPIHEGPPEFRDVDVTVRWSVDESAVGLFIREVLWAAFEIGTRARYGGGYSPFANPQIPVRILELFDPTGTR